MNSMRYFVLLLAITSACFGNVVTVYSDSIGWQYVYCKESGKTINEYFSSTVEPYHFSATSGAPWVIDQTTGQPMQNADGQYILLFHAYYTIDGLTGWPHIIKSSRGQNASRYDCFYGYIVINNPDGTTSRQYTVVDHVDTNNISCGHIFE